MIDSLTELIALMFACSITGALAAMFIGTLIIALCAEKGKE